MSLYLDDEQRTQLRKIVRKTGETASYHLRRALKMYVEATEHKWLRASERPKNPTEHARAGRTGEQLPIFVLWSD